MTLLTALVLLCPPAGDIVITTPEGAFTAKTLAIKSVVGELCVEFQDSAKKTHVLRCMDVVDIALAPPAPSKTPSPFDVQITLWTGDTIFGALQDPDPEGARLLSATLGETLLKFDQIESVRFLANRAYWPASARPEQLDTDQILTKTGDVKSGSLTSIGKSGVVFSIRKKEDTVPPADCAVIFAMTPMDNPPAPPKTIYAMAQLTDGSILQGTIETMTDGVLKLKDLFGTERAISAAAVSGIYFKNGRVFYLSDLPVADADEEANYIRDPAKSLPSDKVFPYQRDKNVKGGKLSIRQQEFRKGLGVHSKSELTFDLGGQYQRFEATVGIDDCAVEAECGSVVFQLVADGKKIWESAAVSWKDRAQPVSVSVRDVRRLTLVVDWGDDFERGDYADWALARVIR
ncbi:MAG: NPCBM/NEW2 domain-containing protein [Planctomycetes bacterium]|nr:NPCBM/NEW2 domain-containing protein [Planctomycetota bacterium]